MHMNSQPISFPQYIDNPNQIGPFEVDDLMPFLMILWVGVEPLLHMLISN